MHYHKDDKHWVHMKHGGFLGQWYVTGAKGGLDFRFCTYDEDEAINIFREQCLVLDRCFPIEPQPKDRVKLGCSPSTKVTELGVKS